MDINKMTNGIFLAREDSRGKVEKISVNGDDILLEKNGVEYAFNKEDGIGFTMLCNGDFEILGYATLRLEQFQILVEAVEKYRHKSEGSIFDRLSEHDLYLVSSRMLPEEYFYMLLETKIPGELFESSVIDDEVMIMIENALAEEAGCGDENCTACRGGNIEDKKMAMDKYILSHGHVLISIDADEDGPGYVYSVGMSDVDWPEFILTGISNDLGHNMLDIIIKTLRKKEIKPYDGMTIDNVMNVTVVLKELDFDAMSDFAYLAIDRYAESGKNLEGFVGFQVIWPDRKGAYPFEKGYDDENLPKQFLV
jgi:hypothetical protein